ncbi:16S rRNA (cytidine(1402)-2'-O)-methyltransferase [Piscinibacter sakaiensis]|uniref:Ribosomal RNA small subunit methyltransferase I n=1 Tax=Piscinibacter sakaiensis TaxID=1547922 RepID=A0A0K8NYQ6_PISS1|nr:16S rRNA (cytidine(1402)-2'-O)-methyltransferase [Piscinibacter sakaiensis]GAP35055.1 rRNA small subunit methyltransferase I [Piscinibacter sakaiensis]
MSIPSAPLLRQAAAAAAGHQHFPPAALYLVATPIGNLADLTLRAIHLLGLVDAVACEDTRHSAALLHHLGLDKPLLALHRHNEHAASAAVLQRLARGERVAYVSDAGTPALSDPGAVLVAAAQAAGHPTLPIPGASSATAALSVAGDTSGRGVRLLGFLPARGAERSAALQALAGDPDAQVLFEAPHRIEALARELADAAPARRLTLARELTKQFEAVSTLDASTLPAWLAADANRRRGEFVLVLHGRPAATDGMVADELPGEPALRVLLRTLPLKQAAALAAELGGGSRKALYQRALAWRRAEDAGASGDDAADGEDTDLGEGAGDGAGEGGAAGDDAPR